MKIMDQIENTPCIRQEHKENPESGVHKYQVSVGWVWDFFIDSISDTPMEVERHRQEAVRKFKHTLFSELCYELSIVRNLISESRSSRDPGVYIPELKDANTRIRRLIDKLTN